MSGVFGRTWTDEFLAALADPTPGRLQRVLQALSTRPDLWQPERTLAQMAQQSIAAFDAMARLLATRPPAVGEDEER